MPQKKPCLKAFIITTMKINYKSKSLLTLAFIVSLPSASHAKIYACNVSGIATYSDQPCDTSQPELGDPLKPYSYMNMPAHVVADAFKVNIADHGVLNFENEKYRVNFESNEDQIITFIQVYFKGAQCKQSDKVNIRDLLNLFDLRMSSLSAVPGTANYAHSFNDHDHKLKVTFMCQFDGALYTAGFSQRYYSPN